MPMAEWEFDVGVTTQEDLKRGVLVDHYVLVQVEADDYLEASLSAIQMAWCVGYATECLPRI
jgi:hypothetical protein